MATYRVSVSYPSLGYKHDDPKGKVAALAFLKTWAETGLRVSPDERITLTIEKQ